MKLSSGAAPVRQMLGAVDRQHVQRIIEAVAIVFLHSYRNPAHEQRAETVARALWPNAYVTTGASLLSEYREYERGTTASVNAAVQPVLDRYISSLSAP